MKIEFSFLGSLVLYLIVFLTATVCFFFSEQKKDSKLKYIFAFLGILILSLFAASRSDEIGKDIQGYIKPVFDIAKNSTSFNNFLNLSSLFSDRNTANSKEMSFLILAYISSRISSTDFVLLFLLQLLTVTPVYLAGLQYAKRYNISISFFMLMYMFLFYLNSFNVMRQSISCAFFLLGYSYENSDKKKMIIYYILAILFHRMAFIGILFIVLGKILSRLQKYKRVLFMIFLLGLIIGIRPILNFLIQRNILSPAQTFYVNVFVFGTIATTWLNISPFLLFIDGLKRTLLISPYISIGKDEAEMYELKNIVLIGYLVYMVFMIVTKSVYGSRLSMFTDFLFLPLWAYFCKKKVAPSRNAYVLVIFVLFLFWIFWELRVNSYGNFQFRF